MNNPSPDHNPRPSHDSYRSAIEGYPVNVAIERLAYPDAGEGAQIEIARSRSSIDNRLIAESRTITSSEGLALQHAGVVRDAITGVKVSHYNDESDPETGIIKSQMRKSYDRISGQMKFHYWATYHPDGQQASTNSKFYDPSTGVKLRHTSSSYSRDGVQVTHQDRHYHPDTGQIIK